VTINQADNGKDMPGITFSTKVRTIENKIVFNVSKAEHCLPHSNNIELSSKYSPDHRISKIAQNLKESLESERLESEQLSEPLDKSTSYSSISDDTDVLLNYKSLGRENPLDSTSTNTTTDTDTDKRDKSPIDIERYTNQTTYSVEKYRNQTTYSVNSNEHQNYIKQQKNVHKPYKEPYEVMANQQINDGPYKIITKQHINKEPSKVMNKQHYNHKTYSIDSNKQHEKANSESTLTSSDNGKYLTYDNPLKLLNSHPDNVTPQLKRKEHHNPQLKSNVHNKTTTGNHQSPNIRGNHQSPNTWASLKKKGNHQSPNTWESLKKKGNHQSPNTRGSLKNNGNHQSPNTRESLKKSGNHQSPNTRGSVKKKPVYESEEGKLDKLWNEFDETFQHKNISPVLNKLEMLSNILRNKKKYRATVLYSSDSTDTSSASLITPLQTKQKNQQNQKYNHQLKGKPIKIDMKKERLSCPYCSRRDMGTNCPTPCDSDLEHRQPLMLQTWTQTTPSNINNSLHNNNNNNNEKENKNNKIHQGTYDVISISDDKENNQPNLQPISRSSFKPLSSQVKAKHILSDVINNNEEDFPYTAWFQTIRSDVTNDVYPLNKTSAIENYRKSQQQRKRHGRKHVIGGPMSLQEAFLQNKQKFVHHSQERLQQAKDHCLEDKHGKVIYHARKAKKVSPYKKTDRRPKSTSSYVAQSSREYNSKEYLKKIRDTLPLVTYRAAEEEKSRTLRSNRQKMKQYDAKVRGRFIKRQNSDAMKENYFIIRH